MFPRSIFIILLLITGSCSTGTSRLKLLVREHETELNEIAKRFLIQDKIQWMDISTEYDSLKSQSVNRWSSSFIQGFKWRTWSDSLNDFIYLNNINEVLKKEKIDRNEYDYFHDKLKLFGLQSITNGFLPCNGCVEFEINLKGLRFYLLSGDLNVNDEYLWVEKINAHWFVYKRDWN